MYNNLFGDKDIERRYCENLTSVGVKTFQTFVVDFSHDENDSNAKHCHARIVPVQFSPARYIKYLQCLEVKRTKQMVQTANWRKENADFVQTSIPETSSHLKQRDMMCVRTLLSIAGQEEHSVDHGTSYQIICVHRPGAT